MLYPHRTFSSTLRSPLLTASCYLILIGPPSHSTLRSPLSSRLTAISMSSLDLLPIACSSSPGSSPLSLDLWSSLSHSPPPPPHLSTQASQVRLLSSIKEPV
eukprot:scaffold1899_cov70-Skeletonema_menzelii.AAC.3